MRVLFRADSSLEIGSGHTRRCLALAAALAKSGASIVFVARAFPGNANDLVITAGHQLVELQGVAANLDDDAAETLAAVAPLAPFDLLVVDHYRLDRKWETRIRPLASRLAIIDDLANREHACDALLDVTQSDERAAQYDALLPPQSLVLLGTRYALLRPEFRWLRAVSQPKTGTIRRVLVSFGAIDRDNLSQSALRSIRQACGDEVEVDIVLGRGAPNISLLAGVMHSDPRGRLHVDTPNMAELMSAADLAIGAGGTTSWERACLGLPAIVTLIADNQRDNLQTLVGAGAAISIPSGSDYEVRLTQAILALISDPARLVAMSNAAADLIDGKGAERTAKILMRPQVVLRTAAAADCRDIWRWRNEPAVRRASNSVDRISWETHQAWFESVLSDPNRRLLIGEVVGEPVGVVRFDVVGAEAAISIYLTPKGRGRGIGPQLLMQGQAWLKPNRPEVVRIKAQVRTTNEASIAAFTAARYRRQGDYYVRDLKNDAIRTH